VPLGAAVLQPHQLGDLRGGRGRRRRRAGPLRRRDARLALEPRVHQAQQLVGGAADLRVGGGESEHGAAERGRLGGREVEGRRRLVEERDAEAPRDGAPVGAVDAHDAGVLGVHRGGGDGGGSGERVGGDGDGVDRHGGRGHVAAERRRARLRRAAAAARGRGAIAHAGGSARGEGFGSVCGWDFRTWEVRGGGGAACSAVRCGATNEWERGGACVGGGGGGSVRGGSGRGWRKRWWGRAGPAGLYALLFMPGFC